MIAGQLARDRYQEKHAKKRGGGQIPLLLDELSECIPDAESEGSLCDRIALRDALNRFLRTLPEADRNIFLRRYWYFDSVKEIAQRYGLTEGSVKMQLTRTRRSLKKHLEREGVAL